MAIYQLIILFDAKHRQPANLNAGIKILLPASPSVFIAEGGGQGTKTPKVTGAFVSIKSLKSVYICCIIKSEDIQFLQ